MSVKLLAGLIEKHLRWYHMNAELPAGLMVLTHIDKDDVQLPLVRVAQLLHHRLHLLAGGTADRAELEHDYLAFLFGLTERSVDISGIAA